MNVEQTIKKLKRWMNKFDGKLLHFKILCEALGTIEVQQAEIENLKNKYESEGEG